MSVQGGYPRASDLDVLTGDERVRRILYQVGAGRLRVPGATGVPLSAGSGVGVGDHPRRIARDRLCSLCLNMTKSNF